jgi:parallel beta-helix repeat protein
VNVTSSQNTSVMNNVIVSDDFGIRALEARKLTIAYNSITSPNNTFIVVLNSSELSLLENSIMAADGMELDNCAESVFSGNTISSAKGAGVFAYQSNQNTFSGNEIIADASPAISISDCYNSTFLGNNISSNSAYGLFFWQSNNNTFIHNNFLGSGGKLSAYGSSSGSWDNGFEGNFWNSYTGVDADLDGIGDTPKFLDSMNIDNFPLKGMFHSFNATLDYDVDIVSDSAIGEFEYLGLDRTIMLRVSNTTTNQTAGFCRMSIPHSLIDPYNDSISVVIDDGLTPVLFLNNTLYDNGTHRWIYFTYTHSTHEILVVPEFLTFLIPALFIVTTVATVATYRRRRNAIQRMD